MEGLIDLKEKYDIAFANDTDFDRHGIVTKDGLMSPNHYLSVAISYLFRNRMHWGESPAVGKTVVSSSMIDRVAKSLNRRSEEHTSELQSRGHLVCRLLLEKKN